MAKHELKNIITNGIKINIIGKINILPAKIKSALTKLSNQQKNNKIIVNLAINYGSQDEIINTLKNKKNQYKCI